VVTKYDGLNYALKEEEEEEEEEEEKKKKKKKKKKFNFVSISVFFSCVRKIAKSDY
jgi:uncharacterized protein YqhQ